MTENIFNLNEPESNDTDKTSEVNIFDMFKEYLIPAKPEIEKPSGEHKIESTESMNGI